MGVLDAPWFNNTTWTPAIAAEFETRLKKSRSMKVDQLKRQGSLLLDHGFVDVGMDLFRRAAELPDQAADARTVAWTQLSQKLIALQRFGDAVTASRHATAASVRSARMMQTMQSAEEILAFALRQRGHAGDDDEALALLALEESRRREPLAVLRQRAPAHGPGGEPHIDVDADLAETFLVTLHQTDAFSDKADVDALFAASIGVLGALDRLWCRQPPMFGAYELLRTRTVFEAGAYVGRVLVKQGGAWQKATPVTSSTVLLGGRVVDPFQIAWDALFTFKPLGRSVQECRS